MSRWVIRVRTLDRRWSIGLLGGLSVVLFVVVLVVTGGADDSVSTADAPSGGSMSASTTTSRTTPPSAEAPPTGVPTTDAPASSDATVTVAPAGSVPSATSEPADVDAISAAYDLDIDNGDPAVSGRPIPVDPSADTPPPVTIAPPPWASSSTLTSAGQWSTDVGCAVDLSAAQLDWFFSSRVGPVLGWDYQHVYPLGKDRYLWIFQDTFVDHSGTVSTLNKARFLHNVALVQDGRCFRLLHRGTLNLPQPFEIGDGTGDTRTKWWWPMGGDLVDGKLWVFWAEMKKDPYDPDPPNGLGWHPQQTMLATYDPVTLQRLSFGPAPDRSASPIYGYAVDSDDSFTYLFGNTFEQNMLREGGFWNGPHSATQMWLARVPRGKLTQPPEYRTVDGWSPNRADAVPIVSRYYAENPMQPRLLDGQWVAATAVDGYWGDHLAVDVAPDPWGPWTTVQYSVLVPRNADPKMNTYHALPLPWRDGFGSVLIAVSNNARNMVRDAWGAPFRYRPTFLSAPYVATPAPTTTTTALVTVPPPTEAPTTVAVTTTAPATTAATTVPAVTTTTTTTTTAAASTTTTPATSTTTTALPTTTSSTTSSTVAQTSTTTTTVRAAQPGTGSVAADG